MRLRMFPTVQAPSQARREVASLAGEIDQASVADVTTVVSELVAISVAHGASKPIEVLLTLDDGKLEGTFHDDGPGPRAVARARRGSDDSLVLRIVDGMVEEWGTDESETGIWFRMAVRPI
jgi:anti-sigma regulatory factor (Ser/Thr protein kinase)